MTAGTNGASTRRNGVAPGFSTLCDSAVQLANAMPGPLQRLTLRIGESAVDVVFAAVPAAPADAPAAQSLDGQASAGSLPEQPGSHPVDEGVLVRSQLVGTYFATPAPGADPFVRVGDQVDEGQQLAIVEAMKLMNALRAPCPGTVAQIHVSDGESVEYDQPLLTLMPAREST
jgi:acetyl-CoA carboxylase biotin carboxyl carrier protein